MPEPKGVGKVEPHVQRAAETICNHLGVCNIGGKATRGHISNSDHYKGLALDAMTSNRQKGDRIAQWAIGHSQVTYVIWQRRIYDRRNNKGWTKYSGSSPHTDHVHISFRPATAKEKEVEAGARLHARQRERAIQGNPAKLFENLEQGVIAALSVTGLLDWLKTSSLRVAMFVGGGVLLLLAAWQGLPLLQRMTKQAVRA